MHHKAALKVLQSRLEGALYFDDLYKNLYATDASVYRELPLAVAIPKSRNDLKSLIGFARKNGISLIPRTAGTSLAGQVVGKGIVVDVSKQFTRILEVDKEEGWVRLEPGVIRDELNTELLPDGWFFGPNTSTSNRCMLGGMVGNNSSGSTSIKYGVTRDKVIELEMILSDGSEVSFGPVDEKTLKAKLTLDSLEGDIYRHIIQTLSPEKTQDQIREGFPRPEIHRRNNGYAIDALIEQQPFNAKGDTFNMAKLIAGSEGTLGLITSMKLKLDALPPEHNVMIAAHFRSVTDACDAVYDLMQHDLFTCEMMDKVILDCTKNNKSQLPNRFFIEGDPEAILLLELRDKSEEGLENKRSELLRTLEKQELAYAFPSLYGTDTDKALELRKAGLGLLGNMVGDKKAVACIEDTAVAIEDLSAYIKEFSAIMSRYGQKAVYYAHAGAGELHLRPILDLKKGSDVGMFRDITTEVANLVKKYNGAMSGEHGDGRVRSEFIEMMIGSENYQLLRGIKKIFDPQNIFNPGKIIDPVPMDTSLRYEKDRKEPLISTLMDFSDSEGILRLAEKCNGSGDCRKTHKSGGVMCPSYHATKNEKDTTRGRANVLREVLTQSTESNRFNSQALKQAFDLCISCKGCSSECPSNVDVATMKAEFLYQYHKENPPGLRDRIFAYNTSLNKLGSRFSGISNMMLRMGLTKTVLGIAPQRKLPELGAFDFKNYLNSRNVSGDKGKVILMVDEFSQYMDIDIAKDAIDLLSSLGYEIELFMGESGRTFISKGFLKQAREIAEGNIKALSGKVSADTPLLGIEPSAVLSFRDEYYRLVEDPEKARKVGEHAFLIEEFLSKELQGGKLSPDAFTDQAKTIKFHGHCHQKSQSNLKPTFDLLSLPENYKVTIINSGCCGMAGSFGYEKEHYDVSMKIGEQRLFPAVRKAPFETIIAANGTSCRHQISDGTGRKALHPVSILKEALREPVK
ncbi:FAD-binding and (Fe-S)-binding domain-containing protein [Robertkochia aurantiaca]|uniref:FAD-binding and (Fe-S)-binding domain-containing protein n=1 Tax=Robertkochia aurantiaca TaxID=2873700 RepID=UPI001CCB0DE0|nr:FAD-binding and (Fe-S)-binding domain-containing protein [Robertkochia sp. 3YJGBD-33]